MEKIGTHRQSFTSIQTHYTGAVQIAKAIGTKVTAPNVLINEVEGPGL